MTQRIESVIKDTLAVATEAAKAGDVMLARALESHARLLEMRPGEATGATTLRLSDGRQVPVNRATYHIRRAVGRPAGTQTRGSALLDAIESAQRQVNDLKRQVPRRGATCAGDRAMIEAVLRGGGAARRQGLERIHLGDDRYATVERNPWADHFDEFDAFIVVEDD